MRLVAVAVVLAVAGGAGASDYASRVVDRTVLCKTWGAGYPDPERVLAVVGAPGHAQATNGPVATPRGVVAQIAIGANQEDQVVLSHVACKSTNLRIPLSPNGLKSGVTEFGNKWRCAVPASLVIRLRAVFRSPVTLVPAPDARHLSVAKGRIRSGAVAVTTKAKVPISYATVNATGGTSSIFVAKPRCQRNRF